MSSTLYNRGTTTQTGLRRRAEAIDKALADTATIATDANRTVRLLEARLAALEAVNTANQTRIVALETRIATLTAPAPAPAVATATEATVVSSAPVVATE
jgi:hypothetical protein